MGFEDQPTQQIRRTPAPAPMPGPMNPAGSDDTTGVLPIDELLGPQGSQEPRQEAPPPVAPAADAPAPATPARRTGLQRGVTSGREWVVRGDNGVIVATVLITLMLLLCVATL
jgi:hypothetical protein